MKKWFVFLFCLLAGFAQAGEPLMLVKPYREIFVNFPSAILPDKAVSVFLPEEAVPLKNRYPVVYVLGAVPTNAPQVQEILGRNERKAIFVGLNVTEKDMQNTEKIADFFSRELIPYMDTNYLTYDNAQARVIAANSEAGAKVALGLLARKGLFTKVVILHGGKEPLFFNETEDLARIFVAGTKEELAAWTKILQEKGFVFGPGFVTHISAEKSIFSVINLDYLFADDAALQVTKLLGAIKPSYLYVTPDAQAMLSLSALLANGMRFEPIILDLKQSPHYLNWNAAKGTLTPLPGATAGKVKITATVDKKTFLGKIRLKK